MEKFEDYFKKEFEQEYVEYCKAIEKNLISAYYDIQFLKSIKPFTARNRAFESFSFKLCCHLVDITWQDLILSTSKVLESDGSDLKSLKKLNGKMRTNMLKEFKLTRLNIDPTIEKKILDFRNDLVAHSLFSEKKLNISLEDMEIVLNDIIKLFNDRQLEIDKKSFYLTEKDLNNIKLNCEKGIQQLIKPSTFNL